VKKAKRHLRLTARKLQMLQARRQMKLMARNLQINGISGLSS